MEFDAGERGSGASRNSHVSSRTLARCRTLHEIAVTANVLNDYGRKPEHADLAERFLLHADAVRWSEAVTHNKYAQALGFDPLDQEVVDAAWASREELRERYGRLFAKDYGWAIGLNGKDTQVKFVDLEELSGIDHLRPFYRYSSHQVHSDSPGTASTTISQGGRQVRLSGYSNGDVFDPVQLALIALHQVTTATVLSGDRHHPGDLLMLQALSIMLEDTLAELGRAQKKLDDAEDRVLAGLNSPTRLDRARDALLAGRARLASRGRS